MTDVAAYLHCPCWAVSEGLQGTRFYVAWPEAVRACSNLLMWSWLPKTGTQAHSLG